MRAEPFAEDALTCDAFLGGRLQLRQPRDGYRAGVDPVLLAATIPAGSGEAVLELGCGAGAAMLCLGARVPGVALTGVELQPAYAALARRNADANGIAAEVFCADLDALPDALRQRSFHHVMANPPYFDAGTRVAAADAGRETGLAERLPLARWVEVAAKRTRPGGTVTMIQRAERLPDLLPAFAACLGTLQVWPLAPRAGRDPRLVLVRGCKGGRAPFRLHAAQVLHAAERHERDGEDYAPAIAAVLRDGAALDFP